ncbi:MAG: hypothetical protein LUD78_12620 [Clostridiales bacterium]|nr:hypothetical protein [Clostridiales bacterium]
MFSSNDLLHFVFANENDDYHCGGLLKLNLDQYLWLKLHEEGYQTVYFLRNTRAGVFSVQTYGDKGGNPYATKCVNSFTDFTGFTSPVSRQGKWLRQELKRNREERVAFVCPIQDFCGQLSPEAWRSSLTSLADMNRRTGILVLTAPVTAEDSQKLLLESPVFDRLNEKAVTDARNSGERLLYSAIKDRKGDSMVFLNTFDKEMVRDLLLRLSFDEHRLLTPEDRDAAADYLNLYLNCPEMRKAEPLFDGGDLDWNFQYQNLYKRLETEETWDLLLRRSRQARQSKSLRRWTAETRPRILREKDNYAERCLREKLPAMAKDDDACRIILKDIQDKVGAPKNRLENTGIVQAINELLNDLETAKSNKDSDTYRRVLYAIQFCVRWVYVEKDSEKENAILQHVANFKSLIQVSSEYNRQLRVWETSVQTMPEGSTVQERIFRKQKQELDTKQKFLKSLEDVIGAKVFTLAMDATVGDIEDMAQYVNDELERQTQEMEQETQQQEADTNNEEDEDINYEIDVNVLSSVPPQWN